MCVYVLGAAEGAGEGGGDFFFVFLWIRICLRLLAFSDLLKLSLYLWLY